MPIDAALARVSELDSLFARLNGGPPATARSSGSTSFQSVLANQAAAVSPSAAPSPPATAAAADGTHYGFVRRSDGVPGDLSFYQHLAANGLGGVVFDSTDPGLDSALATARQAGLKAGIWVPAGLDGGDPEEYARNAAALAQKYGPSVLVLDVENGGKGYPGSPGWNWSERMMSAYRPLAPDQTTAVTVMPNQDDFNYRAYTSRGASVWAQAYGATLDTQFDPQSVVERLLRNGVPAGMAQPVLAAGQSPGAYQGNFAEFSVDDLTPSDFQSMGLTPAAAQIPAAAAAAPVQQEPYVAPLPQADAVSAAPAAPDAAAESYALRRLQQIVEVGLFPSLPTPGAGGYSAVWRGVSALLAEPARQAGFLDPGYWLRMAAEHRISPPAPSTAAEFAAPASAASAAAATAAGIAAPAPTTGGSSAAGIRMLQAAETQVGQQEEPPGSNDGPAIAGYRSAVAGAVAGDPWCADFVSWAARQAGAPLGDTGQGFAAVQQITDWASATGRLLPPGSPPASGDIILFGDRHVGIVEAVNPDGSLTTVEGNSSNAVSRNQRSLSEATGFVRL